MLAETRFLQILDVVDRKKTATVAELCLEIGASEATIRRDLITLAKQNRLNKVHGGATSLDAVFETEERSIMEKSHMHLEEKQRIADYAATLINDDDFVFMDSGTTTQQLAESIRKTNATFVTNGVMHGRILTQKGIRTFVVGGLLKKRTEALIGVTAVAMLENYNFTKSFIGMNGISLKEGYTTPDVEEMAIKSTVMKQSYVTYVLADHSKFGKVTAANVAKLAKGYIITDKVDDVAYMEHTLIKVVGGAEKEVKGK
ncbi:MAG: DeoR/GlpR family DNA-binding transcription regulator [Bifidobacteriaceae bacterium]|jgi:DeoR family fructose operon transcriptional repressor|nr:DeoR/GlpR family DNA-binding transcription regulator [Bifidobacteriaceae bacterium]